MPFCRPTNSVKALKAKNLVQHSTNKSILAADCFAHWLFCRWDTWARDDTFGAGNKDPGSEWLGADFIDAASKDGLQVRVIRRADLKISNDVARLRGTNMNCHVILSHTCQSMHITGYVESYRRNACSTKQRVQNKEEDQRGPGERLSKRTVKHVNWTQRMLWIVVNGGSW